MKFAKLKKIFVPETLDLETQKQNLINHLGGQDIINNPEFTGLLNNATAVKLTGVYSVFGGCGKYFPAKTAEMKVGEDVFYLASFDRHEKNDKVLCVSKGLRTFRGDCVYDCWDNSNKFFVVEDNFLANLNTPKIVNVINVQTQSKKEISSYDLSGEVISKTNMNRLGNLVDMQIYVSSDRVAGRRFADVFLVDKNFSENPLYYAAKKLEVTKKQPNINVQDVEKV